MDKQIRALYKAAPRFDEGKLYQSADYLESKRQQLHLYDLLVSTFGAGITALLEEYTASLYDEMEFEAMHYFQEGYRAAKK